MSLVFVPEVTLSETEINIVHQRFSDETVKKYLISLAWGITHDILTNNSPREGESAESFLRVQQNAYGRLEVINTLLSIHSIVPQSAS